ncbi:MAG: peptidylprolyl isomerase, partial [Chromatiaceae bacterium]|nr:peptidylprolyl isomerase [Chromatiaceae bacterium]
MPAIIEDNKYVELTYKVLDKKTGSVLTLVEFPVGYVHGANEVLSPAVTAELAGKSVGDI